MKPSRKLRIRNDKERLPVQGFLFEITSLRCRCRTALSGWVGITQPDKAVRHVAHSAL